MKRCLLLFLALGLLGSCSKKAPDGFPKSTFLIVVDRTGERMAVPPSILDSFFARHEFSRGVILLDSRYVPSGKSYRTAGDTFVVVRVTNELKVKKVVITGTVNKDSARHARRLAEAIKAALAAKFPGKRITTEFQENEP
jgi:hypothetical protein